MQVLNRWFVAVRDDDVHCVSFCIHTYSLDAVLPRHFKAHFVQPGCLVSYCYIVFLYNKYIILYYIILYYIIFYYIILYYIILYYIILYYIILYYIVLYYIIGYIICLFVSHTSFVL